MYEALVTSGVIIAIVTVLRQITIEVIRINQNKEVRLVRRENGEVELFLKGHSPRHEAALIKEFRLRRTRLFDNRFQAMSKERFDK